MLKIILIALIIRTADLRISEDEIKYTLIHKMVVPAKRATNLLIDDDNILYYSYDSEDFGSIYKLSLYNLQNGGSRQIENILNGRAITKVANDIYFGAGQNIYKYNKDTNEAELIIEVYNIHGLHVLNGLSFTDIMGDVYKINGNNIDIVSEFKAVNLLTTNQMGKVFFTNDTGLYDYDPKFKDTRLYFATRTHLFKDIAVDKYGDVYLAGADGVFKLNQNNCTAVKIGNFKDIYGIAFDKYNHLVYSTFDNIFRVFVKFEYR